MWFWKSSLIGNSGSQSPSLQNWTKDVWFYSLQSDQAFPQRGANRTVTEVLASNSVSQQKLSHCILLSPVAELMEAGGPTCSPSKDICPVLTTAAHDGRKGFTAADWQHAAHGKRKQNQARQCFRGADRCWPSQSSMWNCGHGVGTRVTVVSFFCFVSGQNLSLKAWQSFSWE